MGSAPDVHRRDASDAPLYSPRDWEGEPAPIGWDWLAVHLSECAARDGRMMVTPVPSRSKDDCDSSTTAPDGKSGRDSDQDEESDEYRSREITDGRIGLAPGELDRDEKRNDTNHRGENDPDQGGSNGHVGVSAGRPPPDRDQEARGAPETGSEPAKPAHQGVGAGVQTVAAGPPAGPRRAY